MTAQSDPYSRLYWRFLDEYRDIYNDDRTWAAWTRLLIQADGAYPAAAPLPRWLRSSVLIRLVERGIVILTDDRQYYRIKGMDAERTRRSQLASNAARNRWRNAERNADGNAESMPSRAEPRIAKPSNGRALRDIDTLDYDPAAYKAELTEKLKRKMGVEP